MFVIPKLFAINNYMLYLIPGTLRVASAGGKAQPNQLIQLAGSGAGGVPQFAVVSQGNIISLASSINTQRIVPQVSVFIYF